MSRDSIEPADACSQAAAIRQPFHTTKPGAVGLGLTICKAIAEAHGGSIRAINILPRGLEVGLTLPLEPV